MAIFQLHCSPCIYMTPSNYPSIEATNQHLAMPWRSRWPHFLVLHFLPYMKSLNISLSTVNIIVKQHMSAVKDSNLLTAQRNRITILSGGTARPTKPYSHVGGQNWLAVSVLLKNSGSLSICSLQTTTFFAWKTGRITQRWEDCQSELSP